VTTAPRNCATDILKRDGVVDTDIAGIWEQIGWLLLGVVASLITLFSLDGFNYVLI
jgi:hypothetical protein